MPAAHPGRGDRADALAGSTTPAAGRSAAARADAGRRPSRSSRAASCPLARSSLPAPRDAHRRRFAGAPRPRTASPSSPPTPPRDPRPRTAPRTSVRGHVKQIDDDLARCLGCPRGDEWSVGLDELVERSDLAALQLPVDFRCTSGPCFTVKLRQRQILPAPLEDQLRRSRALARLRTVEVRRRAPATAHSNCRRSSSASRACAPILTLPPGHGAGCRCDPAARAAGSRR